MKKYFSILALAVLSLSTKAQQNDQAAMMKVWMDYMTPGESQKMLAKYAGVWNIENTMWMTPDNPPTTSKGVCTTSMSLGGRYQQSDFKAEMMGQPFEGQGMIAYDNAKKAFINTWIDNMGTGVMVLQGSWDPGTRTISFKGTMVDPMTGNDTPVRELYTFTDDDHYTMAMFSNSPQGKEYKNMEIHFSRNKK